MEITVSEQTIAITAAVTCGLAAGLLYDLLRPFRYASGKLGGVLCDVLFCLFCTASMFLVGMLFGGGRAGVWEGAGFLAAFALYLFGISPSVTPIFGIIEEKLTDFIKKVQEKVK